MGRSDDFHFLHMGLPEDVLRRKYHGDFAGAAAAIDRHLSRPDTPEAMRRSLTVQREILQRLPLDYPPDPGGGAGSGAGAHPGLFRGGVRRAGE